MKFIGTKENFNLGISKVGYLASRGAGLPILNNVLLDVSEGQLQLSTTNLEIGIKAKVRGKAEVSGKFTVQAKVLLDYINLLPEGNIELELVNDQLAIACGNYATKLRGQSAEDFPIIPEVSSQQVFKLPAHAFKRALETTIFAVSTDEMRPEISGALVSFKDNNLTLVGTDSYRLAEYKLDIEEAEQSKKVIIPLRSLQELVRIIGLSEAEEVEMRFDENQAAFSFDQTVITTRLVDGNYPDYQQIIPSGNNNKIQVDKEELIRAVRAAAPFTKTGINDIKLVAQVDKNNLLIKASNSQVGEQEVALEADITGEAVDITFNYRYLLDGLQALSGEKVVMEVGSASTPAVLKDPKEKNYLYLIMPIKN